MLGTAYFLSANDYPVYCFATLPLHGASRVSPNIEVHFNPNFSLDEAMPGFDNSTLSLCETNNPEACSPITVKVDYKTNAIVVKPRQLLKLDTSYTGQVNLDVQESAYYWAGSGQEKTSGSVEFFTGSRPRLIGAEERYSDGHSNVKLTFSEPIEFASLTTDTVRFVVCDAENYAIPATDVDSHVVLWSNAVTHDTTPANTQFNFDIASKSDEQNSGICGVSVQGVRSLTGGEIHTKSDKEGFIFIYDFAKGVCPGLR